MKVSTILDHIDSGHMALPEFQRGYVWNRDQVRGLMDSLYRRHPVGSLLVWATGADDAPANGDGQLVAWRREAPAQGPADIPGATESEEEEAELEALNQWVGDNGLPRGESPYELGDAKSGTPLAILDLAWPNGLQEGFSAPVCVLLGEPEETLAAANAAGFRYFTSRGELRRYVEREVLGREDVLHTHQRGSTRMEQRVRGVLHELGYRDEDIHLEVSGGKIVGYIVSEAFRGESQIDRQNELWKQLESRLTADELSRVTAIFTMTPAEVAS